jgi:hypothetical protein
MKEPCFICGFPGVDGHHPSGSDRSGRHLHPYLKIAYCHDCHELAHDDWRSAGVEEPGDSSTTLNVLSRACRRLALFFARLAEVQGQWTGLARFFIEAADQLDAAITAFDRELPSWRNMPEVSRRGRS